MDEAVRPINGKPVLVKTGALLSRIVVDRVQALDGRAYDVMFISTGNFDLIQFKLPKWNGNNVGIR